MPSGKVISETVDLVRAENGFPLNVGPSRWGMTVRPLSKEVDYFRFENKGNCSGYFEIALNCQCWWCKLKRMTWGKKQ